MDGDRKFGKYRRFILYLVVAVLVNMAGVTAFIRVDLTADGIYTLSEATQKAVSRLSEPLTIHVFFTKNLPAPYNATERYLHDLLKEYAACANTYFNYRFHDVDPESESADLKAGKNRELANTYGIPPVQIQLVEKDEVKFKKAYMGLVLIHGDLAERIPTVLSTEGLEYQLTTAIQKLSNKVSAFLNLPERVTVSLFFSSSLKAVAPLMGLEEMSDLPREIERIVEKINAGMHGKLAFRHYDPTTDPNLEHEIEKYHLMSLSWPDLPKAGIKAGKGVIGLVMEYEEKRVEIPLVRVMKIPILGTRYDLADMNQLEESITSGVETVIDVNEDLGYLVDHGTPDLFGSPGGGSPEGEGVLAFSNLISRTYSLKPVTLNEGSIPEGLKCLVIAGPTEAFSEFELYQIDQALMRGTNLALFLDAFQQIDAPNQQATGFQRNPQVAALQTGLETLLAHYGIRIEKSIVMDENCFKQSIPRQFGGGQRPIYYAPIVSSRFINDSLDYMKNIKGLVAYKISPLELDEKRISDSGLKATKLFSSSENSWKVAEQITLNPFLIHPPPGSEEKNSFSLAYLLEGTFTSYFFEKPIPEAAEKIESIQNSEDPVKNKAGGRQNGGIQDIDLTKIKDQGGFREKSEPAARILVVASSEMIKDNILDPEGKSPNALFILNLLDVLSGREELALMRSKEIRFNPLHDTTVWTKTLVKTINMVVVPGLVAVFGLFCLLHRRSRKKRLQQMFQG